MTQNALIRNLLWLCLLCTGGLPFGCVLSAWAGTEEPNSPALSPDVSRESSLVQPRQTDARLSLDRAVGAIRKQKRLVQDVEQVLSRAKKAVDRNKNLRLETPSSVAGVRGITVKKPLQDWAEGESFPAPNAAARKRSRFGLEHETR